MRYIPPFGISDPDAPWINGDPTIGRQGSIPPAAVFEHPQRELVAVISKSGITPSDTDLLQLTKGVRSQYLNFADDTSNIANDLVVTYDPPITAYTRGLVLRVRVRNTNTGACRINAGAGTAPIRKMNGADVNEGELPVGCLATLVFDGTAFQLSNFGGGGGGLGDVFMVKIPYTVDHSDTPGIIRADFTPAITEIGAGDIIAVKIAQTAPGPTIMYINSLAPITLRPNGGGPMLQGDVAAADVVQFFFDGTNLRFPPNPEINASVTYSIGAGQQFASVDAAMDVLKRKTIGARGFVTLQLIAGIFNGPISVSHPSGDRLCVRGTMIGAAPQTADFARSGNSAQLRAQDAVFNINMLRTRYGTEIVIPEEGLAIANVGAGLVQFQDLLLRGNQRPFDNRWMQFGMLIEAGVSASLTNVTVWGSQAAGFFVRGSVYFSSCFGCACSLDGFEVALGSSWSSSCGSFGNGRNGFGGEFSTNYQGECTAQQNAGSGYSISNSGAFQLWWCSSLGNASTDLFALVSSSIVFVNPGAFGTSSPTAGVTGNYNSMIFVTYQPRP